MNPITHEGKKTMTSHGSSQENIGSSTTRRRPFQDNGRRYRNGVLLILSIVLIVLAVYLINLLVAKSFKPYFNCAYLAGPNFTNLCTGMNISGVHILGPIDFLGLHIPSVDIGPFHILDPLDPAVNPALETARRFIAWDIIIILALVSLALAFVVSKISGFVRFLQTPQGRKVVLTHLSIFLFFFVILCSLFYFKFVLVR
jgi:hypothetical protein